jgi:hypothetical protein
MPSPFPGMDPYLEDPDIWEDFHQSLGKELRDQLAPHVQPRYIASLTTRITYEEVDIVAPDRSIKPDISLLRTSDYELAGAAVAIAPAPYTDVVTEPQPLEIKLFSVEIRTVKTGELVTAIEILSPVNKRRGHHAYDQLQQKRSDLRRAGVHIIEIDLLRAGQRLTLRRPLPNAPYFIFLSRAAQPERVEVWPLQLTQPIPIVPVPLRAPDADVPLDLSAAIRNIYDHAYYHLRIDYSQPPPRPDLSPTETEWIEQHVRVSR